MIESKKKNQIRQLTYLAILTAIVVALQFAGSFIRLGTFSISLVLVPIVIGVAVCNFAAGAWLGAAFGITVFLSGDASFFFSLNPFGTIVTVMLKGILCGLIAGIVYKVLSKVNQYFAIFVSAVVCPVVNTGIFLIGCRIFFWDFIISSANENSVSPVAFLFLFLIGGNFIFELLFNIVLCPTILKIVNLVDHTRNNGKTDTKKDSKESVSSESDEKTDNN